MKEALVIIPAYNEENNITAVIADVAKYSPEYDILVINDCSRDNTSTMARSTGKARVVELPINLGIGGAIQTGFRFARQNNYPFAIQFDGDGQHRAQEIKKLVAPLFKNQADVVIGSRFIEKNGGFKSTRTRRLGIRLFAIVNSLLIGKRITDNTSGFRAYNRPAIEFLAAHYPTDYPEAEAVILLVKNGFTLMEVFTEMDERKGGVSSIHGFRSVYYMIKVLLAILMNTLRARIR